MITINLLPHDLRPIKRTPLPYIVGSLVLVLVILSIGFVFLKEHAQISTAETTLAKNRADLNALDPVVKEANELAQKTKQLKIQVETIEEIVSDRIIWSRQLHNLSRLAKDNMWYKSITQTSKQYPETAQIMNPKTKKLETKTNNVTRDVLIVTGYVVASSEGESAANPIIQGLAEDPEFSSRFILEPPNIGDDVIDDLPVSTFEIPFKIVHGTGIEE